MTSAEEGDRVILKEDEVKDLELGCTIHFSAKFSQGGGGNIQRFWHTLYLHGPSASYFRGDRNKKVSSLSLSLNLREGRLCRQNFNEGFPRRP